MYMNKCAKFIFDNVLQVVLSVCCNILRNHVIFKALVNVYNCTILRPPAAKFFVRIFLFILSGRYYI